MGWGTKIAAAAAAAAAVFAVCVLLSACTAVFPLSDHTSETDGIGRQAKTLTAVKPEDGQAGSAEEMRILLQERKVTACMDGDPVWETDPEWQTQDMLLCDIDRDGREELILLTWKRGSFGEHLPLWVEQDEDTFSQHIFIYDLFGKPPVRPAWMSSALGAEIAGMRFDPDRSLLILTDAAGTESAWRWEFFGLKRAEKEKEKVQTFHLLAAGDVIAHGPVMSAGKKADGSYDFAFLFAPIADRIQAADLACVNLETPLTADGAYSDYPLFASPPEIAKAMADAGFDAAACATNHMLDRGLRGVRDTAEAFAALSDRIVCLGIDPYERDPDAPEYRIVERNGITAALLNFTYGTNGHAVPPDAPHCVELLQDEAYVRGQLEAARQQADLLVVFVHWGTEYEPLPDESQQKWAQLFLEEGTDLVIGTHPHVLQPVTTYEREDGHRMLVFYSLGNLVSAQSGTGRILGGLADVVFEKAPDGECEIVRYDLIPTITHQQKGCYAAWLLDDYPEELLRTHRQKTGLEELFRDFGSNPDVNEVK